MKAALRNLLFFFQVLLEQEHGTTIKHYLKKLCKIFLTAIISCCVTYTNQLMKKHYQNQR